MYLYTSNWYFLHKAETRRCFVTISFSDQISNSNYPFFISNHNDYLTTFLRTFEVFHHHVIVRSAEDPVLEQPAFLSRRQLTFAWRAGETSKMKGAAFGPTYPVTRLDVATAASTSSPVLPAKIKGAKGDNTDKWLLPLNWWNKPNEVDNNDKFMD